MKNIILFGFTKYVHHGWSYTFMDFDCNKPFTFAESCIGNRTGINCSDISN